MFQGISGQQFNRCFKNEDDCKQYLFDLKWKKSYRCTRCGCTKNYKGRTRFHLRCRSCSYNESVTAQTIFHKVKIPLLKAFGRAFRLSVRKKGMSHHGAGPGVFHQSKIILALQAQDPGSDENWQPSFGSRFGAGGFIDWRPGWQESPKAPS